MQVLSAAAALRVFDSLPDLGTSLSCDGDRLRVSYTCRLPSLHTAASSTNPSFASGVSECSLQQVALVLLSVPVFYFFGLWLDEACGSSVSSSLSRPGDFCILLPGIPETMGFVCKLMTAVTLG